MTLKEKEAQEIADALGQQVIVKKSLKRARPKRKTLIIEEMSFNYLLGIHFRQIKTFMVV